ncbi:2-methylpropanoate-CoA ligase CCL4 [Capsicum chacoense]|uniref:Acyl-activating enzyme 5, peroxisomal n=1 Tax=Capsicum annuum TaxID=4072 RepID=A0A2G3A4P3_CAPAN|nr:2-methylpropanoate--CoA ligase CCL4 [Capsicum annuum]KAF3640900.1 putative acyl-activating enzyme 5, peroxisomal [Capsicum annuum]PHT89216.1 putative acyl-activating enzyme 5, peroxisomal [Capsicum annuum]
MDQLKPRPPNSSPLTPLTFLERAATIYADCPSVIYNNTCHTWSQTRTRCLKVASSIVSLLGIHTNHVVSVVSPNIPAMYELHFAVPMAGAVLNTINLRLDARTISVLLLHSESKLLFVDCQSKVLVLEALSLFPPKSDRPLLVLIEDDEFYTPLTSEFISTYEELVEKGDSSFNWIRPKSEFDPIALNYTSGTTSDPKGVVHSHRGIFIISWDSLIEWTVPKQPVYLWTLPMFHANGWSYPWGMAAVGGTNICLRKFDARVIYDSIKKHSVTHICAAPVVLNMLSNSPDSMPLEHPVYILTAGSPPPAAVLFRTESLGFVVTHGYGLTETGGLVISCTWKNHWNKLPATERARLKSRQGVRTTGMTEVDVVNPESGVSVKRDGLTLGEIVLKGACVMLGYLKDPEGTSKCMKDDGWFYTGDVAVMHPDGYLEIKDRSKDVIISGGENLSSVEVESVLYTHPAINEAAVVARPDEYWGETPCAFVSLNGKEKASEKDIIEFCRAKLPHYMVPKTLIIKEELPKTSTGKIQKFVLRDMAKSMGKSKTSRM